jgi:hypothetical protein
MHGAAPRSAVLPTKIRTLHNGQFFLNMIEQLVA